MTTTVLTATLRGIEAVPVAVTVHGSRGRAQLTWSGVPEVAARESTVRLRAALQTLDVKTDAWTIHVKVEPTGSACDLAVAAALLVELGKCPASRFDGTLVLANLSLAAELLPVRGVLPMVTGLHPKTTIVAPTSEREASLAPGDVVTAGTLKEVVNGAIRPAVREPWAPQVPVVQVPENAARQLEVAAAGGHGLLLCGPPGSGKIVAARALLALLPEFTLEDALEASLVYSAAGCGDVPLRVRPLRAPHHTVSAVGLLGGGPMARPGEVSLAHRGVLLLDDVTEFRRSALDTASRAIRHGQVQLRDDVTLPAQAQCIATNTPCPCGFRGSASRTCRCTEIQIQRHVVRLKPVRDVLDVCALLHAPTRVLSSGEPDHMRRRVVAARSRQRDRFKRGVATAPSNAGLSVADLRQVSATGFARRVLERLEEDATRVLRVALTLADIDGVGRVDERHVGEAMWLARWPRARL